MTTAVKAHAPYSQHNRRRAIGVARTLALATAGLALVPGCDDLRPLDPLAADLSRPVHRMPDHVALSAVDVSSQAALDALEARYRTRPGLTALVELLEAASANDPLPHPLLLQRIALIRADLAGLQTKGLDAVMGAGTRLRQRAPGSAEARFIEGWIPWRFIRPDDRRPLALTHELKPFADAIRDSWSALLKDHPDFIGPRGYNAERIRTNLAELERAVAAIATPASPVAPVEAGIPVALDTVQVRALEALQRFETSPDGERRSICSVWPAELLGGHSGAPMIRLALNCALLEARTDEAIGALAAWMRLDGLTSVSGPLCRQWRLISERFAADTLRAQATLPPIDCP